MAMLRSLAALLLLGPAWGNNGLHEAIHKNDMAELNELLTEGEEDINERGNGGQTPLMMATLSGVPAAVRLLLKAGADVTIGEKDGYTPMHGAGFQGRAEIAQLLIDHGLDPSDMHADGYTPLHRACWGGDKRHTEMVGVLLRAGVSPNEPTSAQTGSKKPLELTGNVGTTTLLHHAIHENTGHAEL